MTCHPCTQAFNSSNRCDEPICGTKQLEEVMRPVPGLYQKAYTYRRSLELKIDATASTSALQKLTLRLSKCNNQDCSASLAIPISTALLQSGDIEAFWIVPTRAQIACPWSSYWARSIWAAVPVEVHDDCALLYGVFSTETDLGSSLHQYL